MKTFVRIEGKKTESGECCYVAIDSVAMVCPFYDEEDESWSSKATLQPNMCTVYLISTKGAAGGGVHFKISPDEFMRRAREADMQNKSGNGTLV